MKRILVLDDSEVICSLLELTLLKQNYQVTTANNLQDALNLAIENHFDLFIVDYMLSPQETGLHFVEKLRLTPNTETPVIILSAEAVGEKKTRLNNSALSLG